MIWIRLYFVVSWLTVGLGALLAAGLLLRYEDPRPHRHRLWMTMAGVLTVHVESLLVWASWLEPVPHVVLRSAPMVPLVVLLLVERMAPPGGRRRSVALGALSVATAASVALALAPPGRAGWAFLMGLVALAWAAGALVAAGSTAREPTVWMTFLALPMLVANVLPSLWAPNFSALMVTTLLNVQLALLLRHGLRDRKRLEAAFGLVRRKYATTPLGDEAAARIRASLEAAMESERAFLDPDLSLASLAERLGCAPHQLSQVLNRELGMNFNEYVNTQRVRHACALLEEVRSATVLAVAFASGFNNKSTFNAAFRKVTGRTPREFREEIRARFDGHG